MTLPNLITIGRLLLVPLIIWFIVADQPLAAFGVLLVAGISDAVDGFIARQFDLRSELGTYLDPIADKTLLVSIYVTLAVIAAIPVWLTILIVSRDFLIVGAVVLSWVLGEPSSVQPLRISKLNTVLQIVLAAVVLGDLAFPVDLAALSTGVSLRRRSVDCRLGGDLPRRMGAPHGRRGGGVFPHRGDHAVAPARRGAAAMTRRQQIAAFWIGGLVILILMLALFRQILLPFVAGAALAYALDPVADRLERNGFNRLGATSTILAVLLVAFAAILVLLVPLLLNQTIDFLQRLPLYITRLQEMFGSALDSEWGKFLGIDAESIRASITSFMSRGVDLATTLIASVWTGGRALVDVLSLAVVTPFVAFYLLRDWDKMIGRVDRLLPLDHAEEIRRLAREIDGKVAAFVRGQLLVGFLLGVFYASGLVLIGLNYGLLIGLASGILSFIPYLGFTVGFGLSIIIALVQFWPDWPWLLATVAVFLVGQLLEGYILQPRLIGRSVGLHPVWLIFALFAFGLLFGFVGLLVAIPAAAAIGVLTRYGIERYRASPLFRGNGTAGM